MKKHWYSFAFIIRFTTGEVHYSSTIGGLDHKLVTVSDIDAQRGKLGIYPRGVLLGLSYLGHATKEEILGR